MGKKILVVEDDANIRSLLKYRLEREGYSVLLSADGADALERVATERPELIILDLVLPQLDGFGVLESLRGAEDTRRIPVLVLTAYGHEQHRSRSLELGAAVFMTKPFSPRAVAAEVATLLAAGPGSPPPEE